MKCHEKVRYASRKDARKAVCRTKRYDLWLKSKRLPHRDLSRLHAYLCPTCGCWHIGKTSPELNVVRKDKTGWILEDRRIHKSCYQLLQLDFALGIP